MMRIWSFPFFSSIPEVPHAFDSWNLESYSSEEIRKSQKPSARICRNLWPLPGTIEGEGARGGSVSGCRLVACVGVHQGNTIRAREPAMCTKWRD
ncbi:hypothetical protein J6590_092592 [Homalodisca vitripennis]|nr:hypothetical protein J6590_092592 [Homalodisca vitripennis]